MAAEVRLKYEETQASCIIKCHHFVVVCTGKKSFYNNWMSKWEWALHHSQYIVIEGNYYQTFKEMS